jgi:endonuclease YncB( thermonuclease family)
VIDGDTIWLRGEKIGLEGINAPEIEGDCPSEKQLAKRAKRRLRELLDGKPFSVERNGHDVYGRTLATIRAASGDIGKPMVAEGLAHRWRGHKESWC